MWRNRNTPHLYGVRDIYAVVLTEHKACLDAFVSTEYKSEPNPFSALFKVLGAPIEPSAAKTGERQKAEFSWYPLSGNPAMPGMWLAIARAGVDVNSINRITVQPRQECEPGKAPTAYAGDFLAANGFFSNSPASRVSVSLALGWTTGTRDTSVSSGGSNQNLNGYALAKFFILRPELRAGPGSTGRTPSLGVVVGTNVINSAFSELVVGLSAGHLVGNVGLVAGVNSIAGAKDSTSGRKARPFIGLDYTF
jgi:hypothetical protein